MNRRNFFKLVSATPAAFLVARYGMPAGGDAPETMRLTREAMETFRTIQGLNRNNTTALWVGVLEPEGARPLRGGEAVAQIRNGGWSEVE